jgi:hypothetical protein
LIEPTTHDRQVRLLVHIGQLVAGLDPYARCRVLVGTPGGQ